MIDIIDFENEIIQILKSNNNILSKHNEIMKSAEKMTAIKNLSSALAHIDSYQGNIEDILTENIFNFPAALIIYSGAQSNSVISLEGARGKVEVNISIIVVGQNLIGNSDLSLDVRKILKAIRTILNGFIFQNRTLLWVSESLQLITNTGICAYEQNYKYMDFLIH